MIKLKATATSCINSIYLVRYDIMRMALDFLFLPRIHNSSPIMRKKKNHSEISVVGQTTNNFFVFPNTVNAMKIGKSLRNCPNQEETKETNQPSVMWFG